MLLKGESRAPDATGTGGVPLRGILIGSLLALAINVLDAYATILVRGSYMTLNFSTAAALFFFFFLLLASGLAGSIRRSLALDHAELVTIYLMMAVACCIPCMGFTQFIIPSLVGSTYYATPENDWDFLYNQHIPEWMIPHGETVVRYFFEGLPQGASIPWQPWILPLTYWYSFFLVLSLAMVCSMVILRKQWMERERLIYPLVQVPMEVIQRDAGPSGGLFANKLMWLGFALAVTLLSINGLHFYFPYFPTINRFASLAFFRDTVTMDLWLNPAWIGFFYFVKLDISASIWVFYILATIQRGVFNTLGLHSTERLDEYSLDPYTAHQGMGAMIVFVLVGLWIARGHLAEVFRKALRNNSSSIDDSGEIISYRQAVFGLAGSLVLLAVALWMTGMPPLVVPVFMFGAAVIFLSLTRAVVEGGVPTMRPPVTTASFVVSGVGTSSLGAEGLVALGFTYGWHAELRSFVMTAVANGLKMSEGVVQLQRGRLFWAIVIAILVSLVGSTWMTFYLTYKYGGINLNPLFYGWGAAMMGVSNMAQRIGDIEIGPRMDGWFFRGMGGGLMGLLMWARHRFLWWPLSPLGYMLSANWKTGHIFLSALLAWLFKCLILKYGGIRLYKNARPFFMGLILGEIVAAGVWLIIDFLSGRTGNFLTKP